jgi:hypothetical protein
MICNLPEILVIKLAFHLADRLTADYLPRTHRRDYALECRQLIWAAPESQRRFVIGYLRQGILHARKERIERQKFSGPTLTVEAGRRVDEERDEARKTGGPTAHLEPASHHPATTFPPVSDENNGASSTPHGSK